MAQLEARAIIVGVDKVTPIIEAIEARIKAMGHALEGMGRARQRGQPGRLLQGRPRDGTWSNKPRCTHADCVRRVRLHDEPAFAADADKRAAKSMTNARPTPRPALPRPSKGHAAHRWGDERAASSPPALRAATSRIQPRILRTRALETYRHYDKPSADMGAAVMGISDDEQAPLVKQADPSSAWQRRKYQRHPGA